MNLSELIKAEWILLEQTAVDQRDLLETMIDYLVDSNIVSDSMGLVDLLLHRESIMTTGIKEGFAVPHAFSNQIQQPVVMFASLGAGVNWEALDDQPVQYVFLMLNAPEQHEIHLQLLAQFSRIMSDPTLIYEMKETKTPEALIQLIREAEERMGGAR